MGLAALLLIFLMGLVVPRTALGIPEGGASADTPGTYAEVSPKELRPGATIQFAVSGYPAGEVLNVKIDDGLGYSDQTQEGTGVIHTQVIGADGSTSGSLKLPSDVAEGWHWLRFLASEVVEGKGVLGYTNGAGAASNTEHPTAFQVVGETLGGATAAESVVEGSSPSLDDAGTGTGGSSGGAGTGSTTGGSSGGTGGGTGGTGDGSGGTATGGTGSGSTTGGTATGGTGSGTETGGTTGTTGDGSGGTAGAAGGTGSAAGGGTGTGTDGGALGDDGEPMTEEEAAAAADAALLNKNAQGAAQSTAGSRMLGNSADSTGAGTAGAFGGLPIPGLITLGAAVLLGVAALLFVTLKKPRPVAAVAAAGVGAAGATLGNGASGTPPPAAPAPATVPAAAPAAPAPTAPEAAPAPDAPPPAEAPPAPPA
jgi:hypothetical protein